MSETQHVGTTPRGGIRQSGRDDLTWVYTWGDGEVRLSLTPIPADAERSEDHRLFGVAVQTGATVYTRATSVMRDVDQSLAMVADSMFEEFVGATQWLLPALRQIEQQILSRHVERP